MRLHSYVIEHDYGFAPNPFWGVCTLAYCKPFIRKSANVGDWIFGTGSAADGNSGRLVYWMTVSDIIDFDQYWNGGRYLRKRPVLNGSVMQQFGDNIYHTGDLGEVVQIDSFHSQMNGILSRENRRRDVGITKRVLIGGDFAYFGKLAPPVPDDLSFVIKRGPGHKNKFSAVEKQQVLDWVLGMRERGFVGEPTRW